MFQFIGRVFVGLFLFSLVAGFFGFGRIFSSSFFSQWPAILMMGLVLYFVFGGAARTRRNRNRRFNNFSFSAPPVAREMYESDLPISAPAAQATPKQVVAAAMKRAGVSPSSWQLGLKDLGLLAYGQDRNKPAVVRSNPIGGHIHNLRPFLVIDLPYAKGRGVITIELVDELGKIRYASEETYTLTEGENFITPKTWLNLPNQREAGKWRMNVRIGKQPLAAHQFQMRDSVQIAAEALITSDGELRPQIARLANNSSGTGLSLDDMIASQYEDDDLSEASANSLR
jgi:hypothetical protein